MKVKFYTLGCKTNIYESESMAQLFRNAGYTVVFDDEYADVYIINTCTVTGVGAQKSRQMISKAKKENPNAIIAAAGCAVQTEPDKIRNINGIHAIVGTKDRNKIVDIIEMAIAGNKVDYVSDIMKEKDFEEIAPTIGQSRVRATIKIQDGCSNFCSYCIIPYARGPVRSRKPENILKEIQNVTNNGHSEIVLTGIHLSSYGKDFGSVDLINILEKIDKISNVKRIRLGSLEPLVITDDFAARVSVLKKLCPQFHLSLQSGCRETLSRMNRRYTPDEYREAVRRIRNNFHNAAITTDIMVGFPGETEEEFSESFDFCKEIGFMQMHVFKYSKRAGTKAESMPNQIPKADKDIRSEKMLDLSQDMKKRFYMNYIGQNVQVLVEKSLESNTFFGLTPNYMEVEFSGDGISVGNMVDIHVTDLRDGMLFGTAH